MLATLRKIISMAPHPHQSSLALRAKPLAAPAEPLVVEQRQRRPAPLHVERERAALVVVDGDRVLDPLVGNDGLDDVGRPRSRAANGIGSRSSG
jgi:hypothetical protein